MIHKTSLGDRSVTLSISHILNWFNWLTNWQEEMAFFNLFMLAVKDKYEVDADGNERVDEYGFKIEKLVNEPHGEYFRISSFQTHGLLLHFATPYAS